MCLWQNKRECFLSGAYLENKKWSSGPLFEQLQEIRNHHLSTIGAIVFFCSPEVNLFLVATPGLKVTQRVVDGKCNWEETFLLFVVKNVADLLKLKRQNSFPVFILWAKEKERYKVSAI